MGFFNELISKVQCSNCKTFYEARIQFKFGATRQLEYKIGDKIIWGFNEVGKPGITKAKVYGILGDEECPICHNKNEHDEFDIFVEKDTVIEFSEMASLSDYNVNEGSYRILIE